MTTNKVIVAKYTKGDNRGRPPEATIRITNSRSNVTREFACPAAAARFIKGVNRDNVRNAANRKRHQKITGTNYTASFVAQ